MADLRTLQFTWDGVTCECPAVNTTRGVCPAFESGDAGTSKPIPVFSAAGIPTVSVGERILVVCGKATGDEFLAKVYSKGLAEREGGLVGSRWECWEWNGQCYVRASEKMMARPDNALLRQ